jgi:hypothetical protein
MLAGHLRKIFEKQIASSCRRKRAARIMPISRSLTTKVCAPIGSYCPKRYSDRLRSFKASSWQSGLREQPSGLIEITDCSSGVATLQSVLLSNGIGRRNGQDTFAIRCSAGMTSAQQRTRNMQCGERTGIHRFEMGFPHDRRRIRIVPYRTSLRPDATLRGLPR